MGPYGLGDCEPSSAVGCSCSVGTLPSIPTAPQWGCRVELRLIKLFKAGVPSARLSAAGTATRPNPVVMGFVHVAGVLRPPLSASSHLRRRAWHGRAPRSAAGTVGLVACEAFSWHAMGHVQPHLGGTVPGRAGEPEQPVSYWANAG